MTRGRRQPDVRRDDFPEAPLSSPLLPSRAPSGAQPNNEMSFICPGSVNTQWEKRVIFRRRVIYTLSNPTSASPFLSDAVGPTSLLPFAEFRNFACSRRRPTNAPRFPRGFYLRPNQTRVPIHAVKLLCLSRRLFIKYPAFFERSSTSLATLT